MANEIIVQSQSQVSQPASLAIVTKQDVEDMKKQRELLAEFVRSQLVEADFRDKNSPSYGKGDYGIIPGTKEKVLFKQGAEKAQRLFRLGCRFQSTAQEIDKAANFAMFTYKCEVYSLVTDKVIAECEGSANSQEDKYRERTKWITNPKGVRESIKEETPIFNVINTLQKMAQKRAMIGATLIATGLSEYFTQDILDPEDFENKNQSSQGQSQTPQPEPEKTEFTPKCCGKDMMISKWADKEMGPNPPWYCLTCKSKKPRE